MSNDEDLRAQPSLSLIKANIDGLLKIREQVAVLLFGVDNFRVVNDTFGSEVGDWLLCQIFERLTKTISHHDLLWRQGGDEYLLLLYDVVDASDISQRIQRILSALRKPFILQKQKIYITVSVGVAFYPQVSGTSDDLLAYSGYALCLAKEHGKNNYVFATRSMVEKVRYKKLMQTHLYQALERNELFILYQPFIEIRTQRIIGSEALLRWKNPILGMVYPSDFIPLSEQTGLITTIGNWVLQQVCQDAKCLQLDGSPIRISVNISGQQFQPSYAHMRENLVKNVREALYKSSLDPALLELEITENIILQDDRIVLNVIKKLKNIGVRIACDDFGVGYASFTRLKHLPLNALKIDKSLVKDIPRNLVDVAIVRAVINLAHQLHILTVAEGVENRDQLNTLRALGCDIVQGYFFSKPITFSKLRKVLKHGF